MKKALLVGIDHYSHGKLPSCVKDAEAMSMLLSKNYDGNLNFHCRQLLSKETDIKSVSLDALSLAIGDLFSGEGDVALFYFAGHGTKTGDDIYLTTQDNVKGRPGLLLSNLFSQANKATSWKEVVIILDCCYAGAAAEFKINDSAVHLRQGMSVITSSMRHQNSRGNKEHGVFTNILLNGLGGHAADLIGRITISGLYHYADQLLGPWDQRPTFKTHINKVEPLRTTEPKIDLPKLRQIIDLFPKQDLEFGLNPSYEYTVVGHNKENVKIFKTLQKFNQAGLVVPVGEEFMYFAAMNKKSCALTARGKAYWNMIKKGLI